MTYGEALARKRRLAQIRAARARAAEQAKNTPDNQEGAPGGNDQDDNQDDNRRPGPTA